MLYYLSDLMEDASDFSWADAKASHAVLLCKMEGAGIGFMDRSTTLQSKIGQKILIPSESHDTVNCTGKVYVSTPRITSQKVKFTSTFALIV